jgi:hypothetical protein
VTFWFKKLVMHRLIPQDWGWRKKKSNIWAAACLF